MDVADFDFGAEDARSLDLVSPSEKARFLDSFVLPRGFKINDFFEGKKFFVYGPKGAGKTALLQYIRLIAERDLGAVTHFYYFQSAFTQKELLAFENIVELKSSATLVDDTAFVSDEEVSLFWRLMLLVEARKMLKRCGIIDGPAEQFAKTIEASKLIAKAENVRRKFPSLEKFHVRLSRDPSIELSGAFELANEEDLLVYLALAEDQLEEIYLEHSPIYIFIDEMEVYRSGDSSDDVRFLALASLVRAVRDFNERFREIDIRIIAAVRDEVISQVSRVKGEIHRVVRDRGVALRWDEVARNDLHPLEKIVLSRIVVQDPDFDHYNTPINEQMMREALQKYFPRGFSLRKCLDLTWYRPRDLALLFEEAQRIDEGQNKFRKETLSRDVLVRFGERLWEDAVSGLAAKYTPFELRGLERILRGGAGEYDRPAFLRRLADLKDSYAEVAVLDDTNWTDMLEDLYRVGIVFSFAPATGHKNFYFRGDPMPSFTGSFMIGVHQSLKNELSVS